MIINWLIIHHSAVSRDKNPDQFIANNEYHKKKWNFKSSFGYYLGYHYEISAAGIIKQARSESEEGAHTIGRNQDSIGVCLDGNFDIETPTLEQIKSLTELLKELHGRSSKAQIVPHRRFAQKSCYGKLLSDDWANNLINKSMPILAKDNANNQYIIFEDCRFGWSIPDEKLLFEVKEHLKITAEPVLKELAGYYIVHGATPFWLKTFFNL